MAGFSFADQVFVRAAALPFATLCAWSRASSAGAGGVLPDFATPDPTVHDCFASPAGDLALRLASPSLHRQLLAARAGGLRSERRRIRLNKALIKYFTRWGCRATPFGLFSKVSTAEPGPRLDPPPESYSLQVDQAWIERLWSAAANPRSGAYRNPTLHRIGERSYFFVHNIQSGAYSLRSIDRFDGGPPVEASQSPPEAELKEGAAGLAGGRDALDDAFESGVMVAPAAPRALGPPPLSQLCPARSRLGDDPSLAGRLDALRALEGRYGSVAALRVAVEELEATVRALVAGEDLGRSPANVTALGGPGLREEWLPGLQGAAAALPRLLEVLWQPSNEEADSIHRLLFQRYEREPVALLELASQTLWPLQHESSRGRRAADDGGAGDPLRRKGTAAADLDRRFERWAFQQLARLPPDGELHVDEEAVPELRSRYRGVHRNQSGYVLVSPVRVEGRSRMQIRNIVGPTALSLLGRFAFASPAIAGLAAGIARAEQAQSDGVVCDVSFLPSFHALNVICRPSLRAAEIGLDGPPHGPAAPRQLDLGQLYVRAGERLELHSVELGCRIHPRISCAFNQQLVNDTLFRILVAVQNHEDSLSRIWSWGLQALRPRTPRVSFRDLILCPARWRIHLDEKVRRALRRSDDAGRLRTVAELRGSHRLPRWVQTGTFDQQLFYDLDNPLAGLLLAEVLAAGNDTVVSEAFVPDGDHAVEIAIPFFAHGEVGDGGATATRAARGRPILPTARQRREVGCRWAAFELFAHYLDFDSLIGVCRQLSQELREQGLTRRWFFVRYNDPAPHLRFRLEVDRRRGLGALPVILSGGVERFEELRARGVISEVRTVAYAPELGRYGGALLIDQAHEVFWQDSEVVAALLGLQPPRADPDARLLPSCYFIDRLLARLELSWPRRRELTARICAALSSEFPDAQPRSWGQEYRRHRARLVPLLGDEPVEEPPSEVRVLARVAALDIGLTLREYRDRVVDEQGVDKWTEVLGSILHMHVNRALPESWRWQELRIMQLLGRCYAELEHSRTP